MPSGRVSWTTGSSMTSPPLPTSCAPPAAPPLSAWAPARPGESGSSTRSASRSGRPFHSRPATSGTTSTSTWMPGATNSNASRRKGSETRRPPPPPRLGHKLLSPSFVFLSIWYRTPGRRVGGSLLAHSC